MKRLFVQDTPNPADEDLFRLVVPVVAGLNKRLGDDGNLGIVYSYRGLGLNDRYFVHIVEAYWQGFW